MEYIFIIYEKWNWDENEIKIFYCNGSIYKYMFDLIRMEGF